MTESFEEAWPSSLAHAREQIIALRAENERALAECARLKYLFALKWDATQSAETEALRAEVEQLTADLKQAESNGIEFELQRDKALADNERLKKEAWETFEANGELAILLMEKDAEIKQLRTQITEDCTSHNQMVENFSIEIARLRAAIAWTREVHPGKNPASGGAIVHMTWDQFNAMRALARAALEPKP